MEFMTRPFTLDERLSWRWRSSSFSSLSNLGVTEKNRLTALLCCDDELNLAISSARTVQKDLKDRYCKHDGIILGPIIGSISHPEFRE